MTKYDNSGILYKNPEKKSEKHPDYKGQCTVNGTAYWLAGWKNEGDKGVYLAIKFEKKDGSKTERRPNSNADAEIPEDIPF